MNSYNTKIHEECGVFGAMAKEPCDLASLTYYGLFALQHRGQESCGIVVNDDGVFDSHKDIIPKIFSKVKFFWAKLTKKNFFDIIYI